MNFSSRATQLFFWRAMLSASLVYLGVALLILRPTNWFGLAHCVWAGICIVGSHRLYRAARDRNE